MESLWGQDQVAAFSHEGPLDDEIAVLSDEAIELGLYAEEIFKNASAALYPQAAEAAQFAIETERVCLQIYHSIHQSALTILARYMPAGDQLRRIVELQQIAAEFSHIAEDGRQIAEHALWLAGTAEAELSLISNDGMSLLVAMLRQTYVEVRGCVVVATLRGAVMARRLVAEDAELDQLFLRFKDLLDATIGAYPRNVARLQRLLLIGVCLEDMGNRVVAICRALLYESPQVLM
ncbi:MAG: PhoU domain-containing protein [Ktedonobacterales bacterium]